jgi:hypothetical protein
VCEPLSRRQFLRYAWLVAATPLAARVFSPGPARAFKQTGANAIPITSSW